jgi:hypothetical protein
MAYMYYCVKTEHVCYYPTTTRICKGQKRGERRVEDSTGSMGTEPEDAAARPRVIASAAGRGGRGHHTEAGAEYPIIGV